MSEQIQLHRKINTPVCIFIFLREKQSIELIDAIRKVQPPVLYIVGEGHRPDREGEEEKVLAIRKKVEESVDWPCEVRKNYVEEDIGAGRRIQTGISWVFEQEDKCIFLEDDIRPDISFFYFCEDLLNYYSNDNRIGIITGFNPFEKYNFNGCSYGFSHVGSIYGWASWSNRWEKYDWNTQLFDNNRSLLEQQMTGHDRFLAKRRIRRWSKARQLVKTSKLSTWDFQWDIARRMNNWLDIVPSVSLTENCGVDDFARNGPAHFKLMPKRIRNIFLVRKNHMDYPLIHPDVFIRNAVYDDKYMKRLLPNRIIQLKDCIISYIKKIAK